MAFGCSAADCDRCAVPFIEHHTAYNNCRHAFGCCLLQDEEETTAWPKSAAPDKQTRRAAKTKRASSTDGIAGAEVPTAAQIPADGTSKHSQTPTASIVCPLTKMQKCTLLMKNATRILLRGHRMQLKVPFIVVAFVA